MGDEYREACERWPVHAAPLSASAPVHSEVPTLLLSGELDPVTPARQAEAAAKTLPNSSLVTVTGAAHGTLMRSCVHDLALAFIDELRVDPTGLECLDDDVSRQFFVDAKGPAIR